MPFDILIAATPLVHEISLNYNNAQDLEPVRAVIEQAPERFPGAGPLT
ncbi:MAG TPA: hypothetical protein VLW25_12765 [Bryobacteraceae bacterium]|nr:hypothetical protein [Bryobacteraceae bacterium]